jgi:hypothetical protein
MNNLDVVTGQVAYARRSATADAAVFIERKAKMLDGLAADMRRHAQRLIELDESGSDFQQNPMSVVNMITSTLLTLGMNLELAALNDIAKRMVEANATAAVARG